VIVAGTPHPGPAALPPILTGTASRPSPRRPARAARDSNCATEGGRGCEARIRNARTRPAYLRCTLDRTKCGVSWWPWLRTAGLDADTRLDGAAALGAQRCAAAVSRAGAWSAAAGGSGCARRDLALGRQLTAAITPLQILRPRLTSGAALRPGRQTQARGTRPPGETAGNQAAAKY